jgi:citronellol/citronellal dehydrogenase
MYCLLPFCTVPGSSHFACSNRLGTTEEVSSAATYLLSPAAAYVTGVTLRVDGGSSLRGNDLFQLPEKVGVPPFRGML